MPAKIDFLDSQILSGIYFYHWHLINCKILHLITILSTEFFVFSNYLIRKIMRKWVHGPFWAHFSY